jgi:hypothetical protein
MDDGLMCVEDGEFARFFYPSLVDCGEADGEEGNE